MGQLPDQRVKDLVEFLQEAGSGDHDYNIVALRSLCRQAATVIKAQRPDLSFVKQAATDQ